MPHKRSPLAQLLADFGDACRELEVGWYLFGAQAALLYGSPRLTADADITVQLGRVETEQFADELERRGFGICETDASIIQATRVLPVVHRSSGFPADIVLGGPGLEELFLERANSLTVGDLRIPVASAEDMIAMKVLAGRRKDEEDVIAILSAQRGKLELGRIRRTLSDLAEALAADDLLPTFERLLAESR